MKKVLSYGSLNIDYQYNVPHFVFAGETLSSTGLQINVGGKGLNQSVACAMAGAKVYHAGKVGKDGSLLTDFLKEKGVDTSYVRVVDSPSGHAIIQIDPKGQNCILLFGGGNKLITEEEIDETLKQFDPGDILILQNEISCLSALIEKAYDAGMYIVFNPSPIDDALFNYPLEKVSLLILNEIEGNALTGKTDPKEIISALKSKYAISDILLTLGTKGSVYCSGDTFITQKAYKVKAVDTTGAGDTFTGYFVACISQDMEPEKALDLAARASSIAVQSYGAAKSVPSMETVLQTKLD